MANYADNRCDAGLPNRKRCKNDATKWIVLTFDFSTNAPAEQWPCAVCDAHAMRPVDGQFVRLGPDRRKEYAAIHPELSEQLGIHPDAPARTP